MGLWYDVLDVVTLSGYNDFSAQHPEYMGGVTEAWRLFIKEPGKELAMPHMKRCTSLILPEHKWSYCFTAVESRCSATHHR